METNTTAPAAAKTLSRAARAVTTTLVAGAFVALFAFGAPDAESSRWDTSIEAHSDGHELVLDSTVYVGE